MSRRYRFDQLVLLLGTRYLVFSERLGSVIYIVLSFALCATELDLGDEIDDSPTHPMYKYI